MLIMILNDQNPLISFFFLLTGVPFPRIMKALGKTLMYANTLMEYEIEELGLELPTRPGPEGPGPEGPGPGPEGPIPIGPEPEGPGPWGPEPEGPGPEEPFPTDFEPTDEPADYFPDVTEEPIDLLPEMF